VIQPAAIRTLLCYWELRIGHYLPTAILLLEDMKAAVRLSDFFAILRAFGGSAVRHHDNVSGRVVDFLLFYVGQYQWPAFNVADSAIVVGAALLVYEILFTKSSTAENSA